MSHRHAAARPRARVVAARYGFSRVEHVHIRVGPNAMVATVTGIVHRYPRTVRVPLSVARGLIAAGAPLSVELTDPPHTASGV